MSNLAKISIHPSQFPDQVRSDLLKSLLGRKVNHKFHYDSPKQTQKWLALHRAYSPSRTDSDCHETYDRAFRGVLERCTYKRVHLFGLGCGGGQKDSRLLELLQPGSAVYYTPADVSTAMVLVARQAALRIIPDENCSPLVCDLAAAQDLPAVLDGLTSKGCARVITFLGMLPNFEQHDILPVLASMVRGTDLVLISANLAPGPDYVEGLRHILPQYDNALTQDWLLTFLRDLGVEADDGSVLFHIEDCANGTGLKRIAADFQFVRQRTINVEDVSFKFGSGDNLRLFYSYRHTPALLVELLRAHHLRIVDQWITQSEQEGVFLVAPE